MRKIVNLSNFSAGASDYENEVFAAMPEVEYVSSDASDDADVINVCRDAEVILFTNTNLSREVLEKLPKLKLLVRYGIGYDKVDTVAARELGIIVCNSPKYGVTDVAEHAVMLIYAAAKRVTDMNDRVRANNWGGEGRKAGVRLSGKTIGFLGFGNIGRAVCKRTNGSEMKPIVYDPFVSDELIAEYGAERVTVDVLLTRSDFITCHLPLNEKTYHTLGKAEFAKMKNTAILINTSRGGVINEAELIDALEAGEIAGVGLDVFEDESGKMDKRLANAPLAVLTPHVAWNTPDAIVTLHHEVTDNVVRYLRGERPESIVNGL